MAGLLKATPAETFSRFDFSREETTGVGKGPATPMLDFEVEVRSSIAANLGGEGELGRLLAGVAPPYPV
ncbi:MAG TPA: hypothetical protein VJX67_20220 [Blastocatellia bacterium]|nr:hypothetical protein [Blastocatellia bacterium]